MIRLLNTVLQNKILLSAFVLISFYSVTQAQVTGPTAAEVNSIYRYEFNNGLVQKLPNWILSGAGGTEVGSGSSGTNYYIDVQWTSIGIGTVTFRAKTLVRGVLTNIVVIAPPPSSTDQNYIRTKTPRIATTNVGQLGDDDKLESIAYFDGLGRAMQNIGIRAGGNKEDIITHFAYDNFGRQEKEYLPYSSSSTGGGFRMDALSATNTYYDAAKYEADFPGVAVDDINAFSQKELEPSPLNRTLKQAAPGKDWKLGEGNEIAFTYETNILNEVRHFEVSLSFANNTYTPSLIVGNTYYNAGELYKTITKDENHDGTTSKAHTTEEFKDKQGRVVLKRTYGTSKVGGVTQTNVAHDTYYVYDKHGNLSYVIPPKAVDVINPNNVVSTINSTDVVNSGNSLSLSATNTVTLSDGFIAHSGSTFSATIEDPQAVLNELCYQYKYDHRNRLVEKKIPGKDWEYIVYDKLDRPIMTQDANLRDNDEWLFTSYDVFGRIAYTGVDKNNTKTRTQIQSEADVAVSQFVSKVSTANVYVGTTIYYNKGSVYPNSFDEIYTINYYDNYTFDGFTSMPSTSQGQAIINYNNASGTQKLTKGLATGSKVRVLDSNPVKWITTITGYDGKGQAIYIKSVNDYLSTTDIVQNQLDFTGAVTKTETAHTKGTTNVITEDLFTYDHVGRLTKQTQELNNTNVLEVIVENNYDDLGQLESKEVGGKSTQSRLQTINYTYNVRGWLKQINNPASLGTDLFAFKINYNTVDHSATKLYNGNISETEWKTANDNVLRWYKYDYDALNRITNATDDINRYSLSNLTYDKNGNIMTLNRAGHKVAQPVSTNSSHFASNMDVLSYVYESNSNKLESVNDTGYESYGFKEIVNNTVEYDYDPNGNMIKDDNKGITTIGYNHLNLPTSVAINNSEHNGTISYIYDAAGTKLSKTVNGVSTYYAGNYVYEGSSLKFFNHTEGYLEPKDENNLLLGYNYVYQYKDHLGNVRLSYKDNSGTLDILEENNYYPFGLKHKGYNGSATSHIALKKKFGGKEYQDELGLGWYDITARNYDPALGRWMNLDPLAEQMRRHSPYNYAFDNPVYFIDYDGMMPTGSQDDDPPNQVQRVINGIKNIIGGWFDYSIGSEINIEREQKINGDDASEANQAKDEKNNEKDDALVKIADGAEDAVKGGTYVIADQVDKGAQNVSEAADAATIATGGVSAPVTVPLSKGANTVSASAKVVKATVNLSDGDTDAALNEVQDIAVNYASGKTIDKIIGHSKKTGNIQTKQQEEVQSTVLNTVISWFTDLLK